MAQNQDPGGLPGPLAPDSRSDAASCVTRRNTHRRHMIGDHHRQSPGGQLCWPEPWMRFSARTGLTHYRHRERYCRAPASDSHVISLAAAWSLRFSMIMSFWGVAGSDDGETGPG